MKTGWRVCLLVLILASGLFFRVANLDKRPMHHDEANQAVKFGRLLEEGRYQYDPADHHGPSLYYLTLPFAWLNGSAALADLDETILRLVPAFFGAAIILLLLSLKPFARVSALLWAGGLTALSPVMVYYSRFYIQEMLLVFFILGFLAALWRLLNSPRMETALLCGLFAGLMAATKETAVVVFASAGAAAAAITTLDPRFRKERSFTGIKHWLTAAAAAAATAFIFFSSFFSHWRGLVDSVAAFKSYFVKAGSPGLHAHPWDYYLDLLFYTRYGNGPAWTEALILILGITGATAAWIKKSPKKEIRFFRFISLFTLLMTVIFSTIPYKTPWNMLPFYLGFLLLAGYGAAVSISWIPHRHAKAALSAVLILGLLHLGWQSRRANFVYPADPRNPYVYAHTSTDFLNLVERIHDLSRVHPEKRDMLIMVAAGPYQTWPLPWYLRTFPRVGYWPDIRKVPLQRGPAVLITSLDMNDDLPSNFEDKYITEFYGLRPEVFLTVHVDLSLWDAFMKERSR
jgi:uncharacterized protein (TIGR03663 family)